jgi:hypothetical protein
MSRRAPAPGTGSPGVTPERRAVSMGMDRRSQSDLCGLSVNRSRLGRYPHGFTLRTFSMRDDVRCQRGAAHLPLLGVLAPVWRGPR